ncbi:coiled-coil domain-containing protein 103 [Melanerpes formicivorus]|uniref:coiled-coil domain-containing protein 103 n=1 Tax=Melanerpes formicivorus TaxID=211600 RepID=UPI003590066D
MEAGGALGAALEQELLAAVAADEQRARENEAKLRALRQGVSSYQEFRNIVLASHLKPLQKKDKVERRRQVLWNPCTSQAKAPQGSQVEMPQELAELPGTSDEFYRAWRRRLKSEKEKYQFLLALGGEALGRIFQADLGFGLLGEFLRVLAENICPEDRASVLQLLQSLSGTRRFGLSVELLSRSEKDLSRDLFGKLQAMGRAHWASDHPSIPQSCGAEREGQLMGTRLQEEAEEDRMVMELMRRYQVS